MNRRDWFYLLSLLLPFAFYDLVLKASDMTLLPSDLGLAQALSLMWSAIFFDLGYALLWIGLFAATDGRRLLRGIVIFLFHTVTVLVVMVITCSHQYFQQNGSTLDYPTVAEWIPKLTEVEPILTQDVPLSAWVLLALASLYVIFGPWFLRSALERWRGRPRRFSARTRSVTSFLGPLVACLLAVGFGSLSVWSGSTDLARESFVNMLVTGIQEVTAEDDDSGAGAPAVGHPAANATLAQTPNTDKRNVVIIHLESTRAQSITPYNEDLKTTPFLDELAKKSLFVEQAHTIVPRTSKASVAINCGIEPPLFPGPEFEPGGVPAQCLADLLKGQGYNTVFFQSTNNTMDNFGDVVKGFGYQEDYAVETLDTTGFQKTNTFGYEDQVMLKPSQQWLETNKDEPFLAEYFTGTGHYGYECLGTSYGQEDFAEDDQLNRYLNCMRLQDIFLKQLIDQYKELGLYDKTIFVIYGDHGEGFGEHGRYMHGDTIWEEGLKIPLLIHAPGWFDNGERVKGLSNQTDVLPTVLEMLGYEVKDGQYPGYSLLHPLPEERTLNFSCISERKCMARIQGNLKYIYHYDNEPEEVFDLSEDPQEKHNLAAQYGKGQLDKWRESLLKWRSEVNAEYGGETRAPTADSGD